MNEHKYDACYEDIIQNMKRCGICKHFRTEHHIDYEDADDRHCSTCSLKEEKNGYWSSGVGRGDTCEKWEMMK